MMNKNEVISKIREIKTSHNEGFSATNIVRTCKENDFSVFSVALPYYIDGFAVSQDEEYANFGTGKVVAVNKALTGAQKRLSIAREFAHCILHGGHPIQDSAADPDRELEADVAAAELLMPADRLGLVVLEAKTKGEPVVEFVATQFAVPNDFAEMWLHEQDLIA